MKQVDFNFKEWQRDWPEEIYDGSWPVEYGYDPRSMTEYVADKLALYVVGFSSCPNFVFNGVIGCIKSRAIKSTNIDDALNECIEEFKKHPGNVIVYTFEEIKCVDIIDLQPSVAYKIRYGILGYKWNNNNEA